MRDYIRALLTLIATTLMRLPIRVVERLVQRFVTGYYRVLNPIRIEAKDAYVGRCALGFNSKEERRSVIALYEGCANHGFAVMD